MKMMMITLPKKIKWEDYEKELNAVNDWSAVMRFKVPNKPKVKSGDICFVVHNGKVVGWMQIVGINDKPFVCETTGVPWNGIFIERSGPFHYVNGDYNIKGFQGYRYVEPEWFLENNCDLGENFSLDDL